MREEIDELFHLLPKDQIERVFKQDICDIDPTFMGFTNIYKNLSEIIPKHFTIVDLGCAYNPQCFYFKEHKKYIAVDLGYTTEMFKTENTQYFGDGIKHFIEETLPELKLKKDETFAICSYVPPWNGFEYEMVNKNFKNLFVYYPHNTQIFNPLNK